MTLVHTVFIQHFALTECFVWSDFSRQGGWTLFCVCTIPGSANGGRRAVLVNYYYSCTCTFFRRVYLYASLPPLTVVPREYLSNLSARISAKLASTEKDYSSLLNWRNLNFLGSMFLVSQSVLQIFWHSLWQCQKNATHFATPELLTLIQQELIF